MKGFDPDEFASGELAQRFGLEREGKGASFRPSSPLFGQLLQLTPDADKQEVRINAPRSVLNHPVLFPACLELLNAVTEWFESYGPAELVIDDIGKDPDVEWTVRKKRKGFWSLFS